MINFAMPMLLFIGCAVNLSLAPLLAVINLWYAVPLIVSVSLVCAATRHEEITPILNHAVRFGLWVLVFMAGVMVLLTSWAGWHKPAEKCRTLLIAHGDCLIPHPVRGRLSPNA